MSTLYDPPLDIERHIKFWRRCFSSLLPHHYQSNESQRMALAFFMLGSVDILAQSPAAAPPATNPTEAPTKPQAQQPLVSPEDKPRLREWILAQQHPGGGFCGSPSISLPGQMYDDWNFPTDIHGGGKAGLANLAATAFALQLLAVLSEDETAASAFQGVHRVKILQWLRKLQREDGSFGETLAELPGKGEFVGGGYDMRYCYLASMIRWMLRGDAKEGEAAFVEDFDTERLVRYISSTQTYDGGLAGTSKEEPHAGYAYCAVAALSLLDRPLENSVASHPSEVVRKGIRDMPALIHWLVSRQFVYLEASSDDQEDDDNLLQPANLADLSLDDKTLVGFNGRCNKVADSCYTWWTGASLSILGHHDLVDVAPARRFLLQKTQHMIGGFGKKPGNPPDLYHSFLGLAALAVMGEPNLREFDTSLAITVRTVRKIEKARKGILRGGSQSGMDEDIKEKLVSLGTQLNGGQRPNWADAIET